MSIDAPCAQSDHYTKAPQNFNFIDTYVEYFAEVILKFDNSIPEPKHRQHKELQQHQHSIIISENTEVAYLIIETAQKNSRQKFSYNDSNAYQFIKEINPPPPKFI